MQDMRNTIIYLIGPPGVGKYTVGQLIAAASGARLIHNHYWNNVIFDLLDQDGVTPLPDSIWEKTGQVRGAVMKTIAELSPPDWSFIFTHAAVGDGDEIDRQIVMDFSQVAEARNASLFTINLVCQPEELGRRVRSLERRKLMKEVDGEAAKRNAVMHAFDPGIGRRTTIDTTSMSARDAAERILTWCGQD